MIITGFNSQLSALKVVRRDKLSMGVVDDHTQMDFTAEMNGPMKDIDLGHVTTLTVIAVSGIDQASW